jgi:hypothetical protein
MEAYASTKSDYDSQEKAAHAFLDLFVEKMKPRLADN